MLRQLKRCFNCCSDFFFTFKHFENCPDLATSVAVNGLVRPSRTHFMILLEVRSSRCVLTGAHTHARARTLGVIQKPDELQEIRERLWSRAWRRAVPHPHTASPVPRLTHAHSKFNEDHCQHDDERPVHRIHHKHGDSSGAGLQNTLCRRWSDARKSWEAIACHDLVMMTRLDTIDESRFYVNVFSPPQQLPKRRKVRGVKYFHFNACLSGDH